MRIYNSGQVEIIDSNLVPIPYRASLHTTYAREKGKKILNASPLRGEKISINMNDELIRYDHIMAIDTNTKPLNGVNVSTTATVLTINKEVTGVTAKMDVVTSAFFEFRGLDPKWAERYAWRKLLTILDQDSDYTDKMVAIVVDSSLGELDAINNKTKSIIDSYYLPPNRILFYASGDAGGEYAINNLIRDCDRLSRRLYCELAEDANTMSGAHLTEDEYGTLFCLWEEKVND